MTTDSREPSFLSKWERVIKEMPIREDRPMTNSAAETAGLLALIDHEENYLIDHFDAECGIMPGDVEGSFHRLREAVTALRAEINCLTAALAEAEKKLKDAEWEASDAEQQCDKFEARALAAEAQLTAASSRIEALGGR